MNRIVIALVATAAAMTQSACAVVPPLEPITRQAPKSGSGQDRVIKLTLSETIARYAPPNFQYDPNSSVDFSTVVLFDTSMPWKAAFDKALADAGIDRDVLRIPAAVHVQEDPRLAQADGQFANPTIGQAAEMPTVARQAKGVPNAKPAAAPSALAPQSSVGVVAVAGAAIAVGDDSSIAPCANGSATTSADVQVWEARPRATLKQTLDEWNRISGWALSWNLKDEQTGELTDLELGGGKTCRGTYREAVKALIDSLPEREHVFGELIPENTPPLLRIFNQAEEVL